MADVQKSIKVNIDVVVNQAKQAFADMAKQTQKATTEMEKLGVGAKKAGSDISRSVNEAGKSSSGFFSSLQKDIVTSLAAYDLFKIGIKSAFGFFSDSINQSAEASKTMAQVRVNVENAGVAYKSIAKDLDEYSNKQIQLGFDDEETALSVSQLTNITHDYGEALKLNQTAMDISRGKNISLSDATRIVTLITQGNTKELKLQGIEIDDNATATENLMKVQDRFKNSALEAAETPAIKLQALNLQWENMKENIGNELMPVVIELAKKFQDNLPQIEKTLKSIATGVGILAKAIITAIPYAEALFGAFVAFKATTFISGMASVATAVGGVTTAFGGLSAAIMANPVGIIAGAVGASAVLIRGAYKDMKEAQADADRVNKEATANHQKLADAYNKVHQGSVVTAADFEKQVIDMNLLKEATHNLNQEKSAARDKEAADAKKAIEDSKKEQEVEDAKTKSIEKHKQAVADLKNSIVDITAKQSEFSFKSVEDFDRFGKVLTNTKMNQEQWIASAKQGFSAFKTAINDVNSTIDSLNGKILDAKTAFADFLEGTAQDSGKTFAQIVHDAEKAIPDLQKQIQDAQAGGNDTTDLQKQLADKQSIVESSQQTQYQSNQAFLDEIAFLRSQDGKNDLDQAYAVMLQKIEYKKQETEEHIADIQKQIDAATEQKNKYMEAQDIMTKTFAENVKLRLKSSSAEVSSLASLTNAINAATSAYNAMAAAAARARGASGGGSIPGRAAGGPVNQGQTYVVGENGPELFVPPVSGNIIPNNKIASPSSGGGITINVNNPTVRNDQDIELLAQEIGRILGRQEELARFGSYK